MQNIDDCHVQCNDNDEQEYQQEVIPASAHGALETVTHNCET